MSRDNKDKHEQNNSDKSFQAERDQEKLDMATAYRDAASGSESTGLSNGRMGNQATSQILAKGQQKNSRKNGETITKIKLMLDRMDEIQRELQKQYDHVNEQLRIAAELKDLIASGNYDPNNPLHQMMLDFIGYPEDGRDKLTARSMDDHIEILEERREQIEDAQSKLADIRQMADRSQTADFIALDVIEEAILQFEHHEENRRQIETQLNVDVDQEIQRFMLNLAVAERAPDPDAANTLIQAALSLLSDEAKNNLSSSEDTKHLFEAEQTEQTTENSHNIPLTPESTGPKF